MNNKKKLIASMLLASFISGCDNINQFFNKSENADALPLTAVGVLISGTSNPFFAGASQAFKNFGAQHVGLTVRVHDADNDQQKQFSELDDMIRGGAQAIVINMVDAQQGREVIDKVKGKGIPVIFFNRSPGYEVLSSYDKALFVDGDAVQGGVLQGLDVLKSWRRHPEWDKNKDQMIQYGMIMGIPGNPSAEARTKWSIGTMSSYPELAVETQEIAIAPALFQEDKAQELVKQWIEDGKINQMEVILANNDTMAVGAAKALQAAGKNIPVFGIDAIPAAREMFKKGELAGTVINDAQGQAKTSLLAAVNLVHHKNVTDGLNNRVEYQTILVPYQEMKK